jgi:hypothetical protein
LLAGAARSKQAEAAPKQQLTKHVSLYLCLANAAKLGQLRCCLDVAVAVLLLALQEKGRGFRESFLSKLALLLKGTVAAPSNRFGETLADEHLRGGERYTKDRTAAAAWAAGDRLLPAHQW